MGAGARHLESLFPGFVARWMSRGALEVDWQRDLATLHARGWLPRNDLRSRHGLTLVMSSRPLLETSLRDAIRAVPNLRVVERTRVLGLRVERAGGPRVTGVRCASRGGTADGWVAADLVVDASGRGSRVMDWLRHAGLALPDEVVVDPAVTYTSRWYQAPPPDAWPAELWWRGMWVEPRPPHSPIGGAIFPLEHDRRIMTIARIGSSAPPPRTERELETLFAELGTPWFRRTLEACRPISKIYGFRDMPNARRFFERMEAPPAGLIVLGDALCAFNPIYAQGLSVAAAQASALRELLLEGGWRGADFTRRSFRALARVVRDPWALSAGSDRRLAPGAAPPTWIERAFDLGLDAVFAATYSDPLVNLCIEEVAQMLRPPSSLLHPRVLARVARAWLRPGLWRGSRDGNRKPPAEPCLAGPAPAAVWDSPLRRAA
jgi:2-polyprenyl-6-methoxyphenol hydroxylase-like FAD-dependent oxidoreductase